MAIADKNILTPKLLLQILAGTFSYFALLKLQLLSSFNT